MLSGPIDCTCPFDTAGLSWCAAGLPPAPPEPGPVLLTHEEGESKTTIPLPDSLLPAVSKRRREYLVGRLCAALALRRLGASPYVGMAGRAPVWPAGWSGSISHSDRMAVAVASGTYRRLGVDCEERLDDGHARDLGPSILAPGEASLRPQGLPFADFLTLVFSAKEAFYKAHADRFDRMPEFRDVTLVHFAADDMVLSVPGWASRVQWKLYAERCFTLVAEAA